MSWYYETAKKIGAAFVERYTLVSHHTASYEHFIKYQLGEIFEEISPIVIHVQKQQVVHHIVISDAWIAKPTIHESTDAVTRRLLPKEAILRKQTLLFDVYVNIEHKVYRSSGSGSGSASVASAAYHLKSYTIYKNILLFKCPSMVGSSTCHTFGQEIPSATFIINGYIKTLISQEKLKTNHIFVFPTKTNSKYLFCAEIRSFHANKIRSTSTLYVHLLPDKYKRPVSISVKIPFIKTPTDIKVIFALIGVEKLEDQIALCQPENASPQFKELLCKILGRASPCPSSDHEDLLEHVGREYDSVRRKRIQIARNIFTNEFLPHCHSATVKAVFVGRIVCKLLKVYLREQPIDNKDSYLNKRITCAGSLMSVLLCQLVKSWKKRLMIQIFKAETNSKPFNLPDFINHRSISGGMKHAFSTGCWGIQRQMKNQFGVCQVVNNVNLVSQISHCRALNIPLNRDGKSSVPRLLSETAYGVICAAETPEGKSVGLLKSLSFLALVRVGCPARFLIQVLRGWLCQSCTKITVMVNGIFIGYSEDGPAFVARYKEYRRWQAVPLDSSIYFAEEEGCIYIQCDEETIVRPLVNLVYFSRLAKLYSLYGHIPVLFWNRLICEGVVEFVSKEEEQNLEIALNPASVRPECTHMEILEQFTLFGVAAGVSVLNGHNASPRNIYSSNMAKHAIGSIPLDLHTKLDNKIFWLNYPQKNIVNSVTADIIGEGCSDFGDSAAQCVVMAISCFGGHNQEDSVIIKREFLERGGFSTTMSRVQRDSENSYGDDFEKFGNSKLSEQKVMAKAKANYGKLDTDGLALVGVQVTEADVIIGKSINFKSNQKSNVDQHFTSERICKDRSTVLKGSEPGNVHSVMVAPSRDGHHSASVRVLSIRPVEVGDKFASRCGQKGVNGRIVSEVDMYFTEMEGITPDIIVNPHAIPSRMTISHLIEALLGKQAAVTGKLADGTSFADLDIHELEKSCKKNGIYNLGKQYMINGQTGERMKQPVFIGVMTYMRLKHLVEDKIHARACGRKQILTRQPVEGRSRDGGLRFGEMERDACVAYGASSVLLDRFMLSSDVFDTVICKSCGRFAEPAKPQESRLPSVLHRKPYCRLCQSNSNIVTVKMPYAFCLLYNELNALHIGLKFDIV